MKNYLDKLKSIEDRLNSMHRQMIYETEIERMELEERMKLGLKGDDEVKHYNAFMLRYGLGHLCVNA